MLSEPECVAVYLASIVDIMTDCCFLLDHENALLATIKVYLLIDVQSEGSDAKSAST